MLVEEVFIPQRCLSRMLTEKTSSLDFPPRPLRLHMRMQPSSNSVISLSEVLLGLAT